jgi:hypothetical protein
MAKGTDFGGIHSHRDLHLIQQSVKEQPAEPKLNLVDIPGANGSKDMSELPGGQLCYKDRTITWTFALYPGEDWDAKHRQVSNELNGKRCKITLDTNPDYYYSGRVVVKDYNKDRLLRQITVEAICSPYMLKHMLTIVTVDLATGTDDFLRVILPNEKMPTTPTIEVTTATTIRWSGMTTELSPGVAYNSLGIMLLRGPNLMEARSKTRSGKIVVTYQEGSL